MIDVVEFPLNYARREALEQLVPVCQKHDVGMVVMKPVNVGLAPASVTLPWLANQPIHVMAAGVSTIEQLELDVAGLDRPVMALSAEEEAEVERWRQATDKQTCHICDKVCQAVCEPGLPIDHLLYHDVFHNELRRLGAKAFAGYPFAPWVKQQAEHIFAHSLEKLQTCTRCGKCEAACPYHLPVMAMLEQIKAQKQALLEEIKKA